MQWYQLGLYVTPMMYGFTFGNIPVVKIEGLAFVACAKSIIVQDLNGLLFTIYYELYLQSVQMAEIIDCIFQDSYGSAVN